MNINYPVTRKKIAECKEKSELAKTRDLTIYKTSKYLKTNKTLNYLTMNKVTKFFGMLRAKNEKGQLIYITEAIRGGKYTCPVCGHNVIAKLGTIRAHHFAHKANNSCDKWHEMTDWHRNWQELFPEKFREIILKDEVLGIHRADIKVGNLIIEFQHSYLGLFEWDKRINFYNKYGLLVFVLDVRNKDISQINSFSIEDIENCKYIFNWNKEHNAIPPTENYNLFLQQDENNIIWVCSNEIANNNFKAYGSLTKVEFLELMRLMYKTPLNEEQKKNFIRCTDFYEKHSLNKTKDLLNFVSEEFNKRKQDYSIPIIKSKFNNKLASYEKTYFRKQNELNKQSLNLESYYKVMKEEIENAKINLKKSYEIDRKKAEIEFKKSINTAPFQLKKSKEIFESKKSHLLTIINRLNINKKKDFKNRIKDLIKNVK